MEKFLHYYIIREIQAILLMIFVKLLSLLPTFLSDKSAKARFFGYCDLYLIIDK